jgi:hypothetical protein
VAALQERFFARRERGDWFRAQPEEVRAAIGERAIVDLYRTSVVNAAGETVAATRASNAARMAAALERRHGPLTVLPP